jgi:predicted acylesterase/phospholipase RssA
VDEEEVKRNPHVFVFLCDQNKRVENNTKTGKTTDTHHLMELDYRYLGEVLRNHDFALGLSPGFFRFYALAGVLTALEEKSCLRATHISGASAGALVGGLYASGVSPKDSVDQLMSVTREDVWDMGGFGGLLQGRLFHDVLTKQLLAKRIEDCKIPFGATAFDLVRFHTNCIQKGCLATAIRASCTFPGLFQPVIIDNTPHIDGGVFDDSGLMALPGIPDSNLIVNIVCGEGREASSVLPPHLSHAKVII